MMQIANRLINYAYLTRFDKPIGILLLLWPTLWALWLASQGHPDFLVLTVFVSGVVLMRAAGCAVNDMADKYVDMHVARTRERPVATGKVSRLEAGLLAAILAFVAFLLVLLCNSLTIKLAFVGAVLAVIYPFMKRVTNLPQAGLAMAFTWGVPMAFAAETGEVPVLAWLLFVTCSLWPIIYDTMYAMVDRADDLKIGVKSTAILFNQYDKLILGLLQASFIVLLVFIGILFKLQSIYYLSIIASTGLFIYQQWLIKDRFPANCFRAFQNNHWVGLIIFMGIMLSYLQ